MRKINKKFTALLMVFTSIVSFLPVGFSGQQAKADASADASIVRIHVDGKSTSLTRRNDSTIDEEIYATDSLENAFDITVKKSTKSITDLKNDAKNQKTSITGVVGQKVILKAVNGTNLVNSDGVSPNADGYNVIKGMGISVSSNMVTNNEAKVDDQTNALSVISGQDTSGPISTDGLNDQRIGARIQDLPAGVNKITYEVQLETIGITYTPSTQKDATGNIVGDPTIQEDASTKKVISVTNTITIEHGKTYAVSKISNMLFKAYIGDAAAFNTEDTISDTAKIENNKVPFLYSTTINPDPNMALRYNFDVPDSLSALKYVMTFGDMLKIDSTGIDLFKNGVKAGPGDYSLSGQTLSGNLASTSKQDLIVIKIKSEVNTTSATTNISKAYAIEIRYNKLPSDKDYSLVDAGITKLNYDANSNVKAYIGKKFDVTQNSAGFKEYKGTIYIDPRAEMISIDPKLIKSKDGVAYVVTNNYVNSSGVRVPKESVLKNGKQFIDFKASTSSNQLQVDVYEGENGSVKDSSKILARYILDVVQNGASNFSMDLNFTTTTGSAVYLTQPGVKANVIDKFTTDRRTYDLYFGAPSMNKINVTFSGSRSDLNEYLKVWFTDEISSSDLREADGSIGNGLVFDPVSKKYVRNTSFSATVGKSKKMVVQAYYDEFQYETINGVKQLKMGTDGKPVYTSQPIGDKYVFYLPENYVSSDTTKPDSNERSNDASLSSMKVSGYTLKDSDGNSGFTSDKLSYTTTVNKEDTSAKLTVTAQNSNAKSIELTVDGSDQVYNLASGQEENIPLNSRGTTNLKIVVTAQDGTTKKTYTVTIKNNTKGSNINLKNIIVNPGDYTFDAKADTTKVRVDQNVTSVKITPVPEEAKSKVTINGEVYSNDPIVVSVKGNQKTEISVQVTSEDGSQSKTYTVVINRVDVADWNNNNTNTDRDDQFYDEYNDSWVDLTKYEEWGTVNGKPVYFDNHNRQVKNAWITSGGKTYFLNNLGFRASGWKVDTDGKSYYLDPTSGEIRTGWINLNNSWYYLALNGVMKTGWLSLNGKWYYFTPNGQMVVNQTMYIDDKLCTFGQDGALIS